jgi:hypothetical protein
VNFRKSRIDQDDINRKFFQKIENNPELQPKGKKNTCFKISETSLMLYIKLLVTFHYNMMQLDMVHIFTSLSIYSSELELFMILLDCSLILTFELKIWEMLELAVRKPIKSHNMRLNMLFNEICIYQKKTLDVYAKEWEKIQKEELDKFYKRIEHEIDGSDEENREENIAEKSEKLINWENKDEIPTSYNSPAKGAFRQTDSNEKPISPKLSLNPSKFKFINP